jgi:hypothetical protein
MRFHKFKSTDELRFWIDLDAVQGLEEIEEGICRIVTANIEAHIEAAADDIMALTYSIVGTLQRFNIFAVKY